MTITRDINERVYKIKLSNLYKTRQDNELTTDELVKKYESRIVDGTLNGVEDITDKLEGLEYAVNKLEETVLGFKTQK